MFKAVSRDGDVEYWATNDLTMDESRRLELAAHCWAVEEHHHALKQLFVSCPPHVSASYLAQRSKGQSSRKLMREFSHLNKPCRGRRP